MPTLIEWPLPLNPPNFKPFYLRYLSPPLDGRLYYTKYIVDYIGELSVNKEKSDVREWNIPAALGAGPHGNPCGIVYSLDEDRVWFALESGHRLVEFDPASGQFTAYGGAQFPIPFPRHIMFDATGALWYTGIGKNGALIGRLAPDRASVTFWDLPVMFLTPEGLWVEESGKSVWFTPINPNLLLTGAFLARLTPASGEVTWWSYPAPGRRPWNPGVAGSPRVNPENIWFSYSNPHPPSSRVFRLHVASGVVSEYPPAFGQPRRIAVDQTGNAWVTDVAGHVSRIVKNDDCGRIKLPRRSLTTVRPKRQAVRVFKAKAEALHTTSVPMAQPVNPIVDGCYLNFPDPSPWSVPNGIALGDRVGGPDVYFTDVGLNRIALLTP